MRFASYTVESRDSYGVLTGDKIVDLGNHHGDQFPTLRAAIAANALSDLADWAADKSADIDPGTIAFTPLIPDAEKVICFGMNYAKRHPVDGDVAPPENPNYFLKPPGTLVGHGRPMVKPIVSDNFDYEGELGVVIGRPGRHIEPADALSYVAGYTCVNDGSVRDWQRHSVNAGKNFQSSGSCGPWLVTADEIADPGHLRLITRLNGKEMQNELTELMIFNIPTQISYLSKIFELTPGDVIATGSPEGSGASRNPQIFMAGGDTIEIEIEKVGRLENSIIDEPL